MKRSKWFGLWNNNEDHYMVSQPLEIDSIKEFVEGEYFRLIVKKNKYYEKGGNRPYYCFSIGNCKGAANNKITSYDMQYFDCEELEERIEELENKLSDCISKLKSIGNRYEWGELDGVDLWLEIDRFLDFM